MKHHLLFCTALGLLIALAACHTLPGKTQQNDLPTRTYANTAVLDTATIISLSDVLATPMLLPTETPSPSPPNTSAPVTPTLTATQISHRISPENAGRLSLYYKLGKGVLWCLPVFSPDGSRLAVFSSTGAHIYDTNTYEELSNFPTSSWASVAAFSPDGKILAATIRTSILLWDAETGRLLRQFDVPESTGEGVNLNFSPNGQQIVASFSDNLTRGWHVQGGDSIYTLPSWSFQFSTDGEYLVTFMTAAGYPVKVILHKAATGAPFQEWIGQRAVFLSDNRLALEANGVVSILDLATLKANQVFNGSQAAFSPDFKLVALVSSGQVQLLDAQSGAILRTFDGAYPIIQDLHFSPDGQILAGLIGHTECCGGAPDTLVLWQISDGAIRSTAHTPDYLQGYAFSPDGATLMVAGRFDVLLLDAHDGAQRNSLSGFNAAVAGVAISPNNQILAAAFGEPVAAVQLWQLRDGQPLKRLEDTSANGGAFSHLDLALNPGGNILALRGNLWNLNTDERLSQLETTMIADHSFWASSIAFSPHENILATGSFDGYLALWDLENAQLHQKLHGTFGEVTSLAYSPDGKLLAAVTGYPDYGLWVWRLPEGELIYSHKGENEHFRYVIFSPDSQLIASLSSADEFGTDGYIRIWNASDGTLQLQTDVDVAASMAFSPDGSILALGCQDGSLRLRRVQDGSLLASLPAHNSFISGVAFTPDGLYLASGSDDGTVALWNIP